jgi:hypothetical protein
LGNRGIKVVIRTKVIDPSALKIVIVGLLIALEGFAVSAYSVLQTGQMPSNVNWATYFFAMIIQLATYLITFLETGESPVVQTTQTTKA